MRFKYVFIEEFLFIIMSKLSKIYSDIKEVKIQGATNIAKAAIGAYLMKPDLANKKKLLSLRPTEPTLANTLNFLGKIGKEKTLKHFFDAQEKINKNVFRIIRNGMIIYTHCHSTNVVKALIYAKKHWKKFSVVNTETRPLFQGRRTARELSKAGIKVTTYIDSAMDEVIMASDMIFLGADAILKNKFINKIGSLAIAELSSMHKKPVYVVADSWKFSPKNVPIEERDFHEVWKRAPKKIKIINPSFESVPKKFVKAVISEYGVLSFNGFVKKADKAI